MSATMPPKASLTQAAYERLRADLLACRFEPEQRLNINELCDTIGVSLGAIREALARLASEGLVVAEPQRGFRVAEISVEDMLHLFAARIELEGLCLKRSIEVGGLPWETRVVAAYYSLSKTPEQAADGGGINDDWLRRHAEFHAALVSACDNPWLLRLRAQLFDHAQRFRRLSAALPQAKRNVDQEHRDLMEAALARDAERAVALMREHLQQTADLVRKGVANTVSQR